MNIKVASLFFVLLMLVIANSAEAWEVDFSHHKSPQMDEQVPSAPSTREESTPPPSSQDLGSFVIKTKSHPSTGTTRGNFDRQEIVILNTQNGFVPANVRLHKGLHYVIHIVNVNEQKKNVSFIMDAFNQHHATYYGQVRSFDLDPEREGIFDYECPETTSVGKLVVFGTGKTSAPTQTEAEAAPTRNVSSESAP